MVKEFIIESSNDIIGADKQKIVQREYRPSIINALNILNSKRIIGKELVMKINELRQYRNYVVHGTDPVVDIAMYNLIKQIYDEVNMKIERLSTTT